MDHQAVALRVLAHFVPGGKVLDFLAPEADWLDIRWCAENDDTCFYRELPDAEVIWHSLRPLSGDDLRRGTRLRLVHKFGAGVNTIDVETAAKCGIAVANMPGANAPTVAEGTVLLMLAALRRLLALDPAVSQGHGVIAQVFVGGRSQSVKITVVGIEGNCPVEVTKRLIVLWLLHTHVASAPVVICIYSSRTGVDHSGQFFNRWPIFTAMNHFMGLHVEHVPPLAASIQGLRRYPTAFMRMLREHGQKHRREGDSTNDQ